MQYVQRMLVLKSVISWYTHSTKPWCNTHEQSLLNGISPPSRSPLSCSGFHLCIPYHDWPGVAEDVSNGQHRKICLNDFTISVTFLCFSCFSAKGGFSRLQRLAYIGFRTIRVPPSKNQNNLAASCVTGGLFLPFCIPPHASPMVPWYRSSLC